MLLAPEPPNKRRRIFVTGVSTIRVDCPEAGGQYQARAGDQRRPARQERVARRGEVS
jgi:hypothetical protein